MFLVMSSKYSSRTRGKALDSPSCDCMNINRSEIIISDAIIKMDCSTETAITESLVISI